VRVAVNQGARHAVDIRKLKKACRKVLKAEGMRRDTVLSISAVDTVEMEGLNRRYLYEGGATDVLAFPMGEKSRDGYLLGDVIICPDYIVEKREEYGVEEGRELEFVTAHGVLHLLGYEDGDERGALEMDRRQRKILGLAGGGER